MALESLETSILTTGNQGRCVKNLSQANGGLDVGGKSSFRDSLILGRYRLNILAPVWRRGVPLL